MSQLSLLLPRSDNAPIDEETGVRIAWALDGGRPVHIHRYAHLRDGVARPALTCLGCQVPVHAVLPARGKGRTHRLDHFRHKRRSPDCWAHHGTGAMLWNVTLGLHRALDDVDASTRARLTVRLHCDAAASRWSTALPLFRSGCPARRDLPLPRHDRIGLSPTRRGEVKAPDLRGFLGEREVWRLRVSHATDRTPAGGVEARPGNLPVLHVSVDERTYPLLLAWDPERDPVLPVADVSGSWRRTCADHSR